MSAIAMLPDDLLIPIFCAASGPDIGVKFVVAQVSRRWRFAALSAPLLWSNIRITSMSSRADSRRLALVLEWSGTIVPLQLELSGPFPKDDSLLMEPPLVSNAARISVLYAIFVEFNGLLMAGIDFPSLRVLCLHGHGQQLHLTAPNLRILWLQLADVTPHFFDELLSHSLEEVRIEHCWDLEYDALISLLARCPNLRHLTFRTVAMSEPTDAPRDMADIDRMPLRKLETLYLQLPQSNIRAVLDNHLCPPVCSMVGSIPVPRQITVNVYSGRDARKNMALCASLLRGTDPIIAFDMTDPQNIALRDVCGRTRIMTIESHQSEWENVWPCLAESHAAQDTVQEVTVPFIRWHQLVFEFARHPPKALRRLRVLSSRDDFNLAQNVTWSEEDDDPIGLRPLPRFPALEGVDFSQSADDVDVMLCVLQGLTGSSNDARPIEVAISETLDLKNTRERLQRESRGTWKVVSVTSH